MPKHNATTGVVITNADLYKYSDAYRAEQREKAIQAEQAKRNRELNERLDRARKKAEADCEGMWKDHMEQFKQAQAGVMQAESQLLTAQQDVIAAEYDVRGVFRDLNSLRVTQDFAQDAAGVAIGAAGFFASGGTAFVILTALGAANNLARPDLVGAAQDTFNNGVAELATRNGYVVGGNVVSAFALGKDALEFTNPADLYNFEFSRIASVDDIGKIREFFAKDPRGLAERIWGPSVKEVDAKLASWQDKIRARDAKAEELRKAKKKLSQITGEAGNWAICVDKRMGELMGW
jgi:hypothetical protein